MSQSHPLGLPLQGRAAEYAPARTASIPWTIWFMVAGLASGAIGGIWDISWHMSIGRDTFWTPAHIAIQLTGVLVGIACAYMILHTTFAGSFAERDASVQVMGFRAPVGAFIAVWGCVAMLASAPFDNWWHNAYGLDVKIVSPPHILLSAGSFAIKIGALALISSVINRSEGALRSRLTWLFVFVGGIGVSQLAVMIIDPTWLQNQHTAACYLAVALLIPTFLIGTGWGTGRRWGCTMVASVYTAIGLASEWILPLFPAQPKLGPVYQNVTHLVPLRFPLLFIVPAIVADLVLQKLDQRSASPPASSWLKATVAGPAFVLSFMVVQWPFANFLMSPAARNWIFGSHYLAYFDPAGFLYDRYKFQTTEKTGVFLTLMAIALVVSVLTTRLGLGWGEWMRRVRR
jgi:hypothetical protein